MRSTFSRFSSLITLILLVTLAFIHPCDAKRPKTPRASRPQSQSKVRKQQNQEPIVISSASQITGDISKVSTALDALHRSLTTFDGSWYQGVTISTQFDRLSKRVKTATTSLERLEVEQYIGGVVAKGVVRFTDSEVGRVVESVDELVVRVVNTLEEVERKKALLGAGVYASQAKKALSGLRADASTYFDALDGVLGGSDKMVTMKRTMSNGFEQALTVF